MRFGLCQVMFLILILIACNRKSSDISALYVPCDRLAGVKYTDISFSLFDLIIQGDTSQINEVKYECSNSAFIVSKSIYNIYGKWDKIIELENKRNLIVWDSLFLLSNRNPYTLLARNYEGRNTVFGSFMILSQHGDELSEASTDRDSLIAVVTRLIDDSLILEDSSFFYRDYWLDVNPSHWRKLENYRKNKRNHEKNWWR